MAWGMPFAARWLPSGGSVVCGGRDCATSTRCRRRLRLLGCRRRSLATTRISARGRVLLMPLAQPGAGGPRVGKEPLPRARPFSSFGPVWATGGGRRGWYWELRVLLVAPVARAACRVRGERLGASSPRCWRQGWARPPARARWPLMASAPCASPPVAWPSWTTPPVCRALTAGRGRALGPVRASWRPCPHGRVCSGRWILAAPARSRSPTLAVRRAMRRRPRATFARSSRSSSAWTLIRAGSNRLRLGRPAGPSAFGL